MTSRSAAWAEANPEARRAGQQSWYQRNREAQIAKALESRTRYRERNVRLVREAKDRPCADCGVKYPYYVMHFDHLGDDKEDCVSRLANRPVSQARLEAEIAKCEVVCSNCHAERTHQRSRRDIIRS